VLNGCQTKKENAGLHQAGIFFFIKTCITQNWFAAGLESGAVIPVVLNVHALSRTTKHET